MVRKIEVAINTANLPAEIDVLYAEFLKHFYGDGDSAAAACSAARLEEMLANSPAFAESIRGEEIRSLVAELRGDFAEAIRSREAEIRKILELHTLAVNTPSWEYVSRQYDFSDVGDRLDLLANLYDRLGETPRPGNLARVPPILRRPSHSLRRARFAERIGKGAKW
jgi:hypothetical protein